MILIKSLQFKFKTRKFSAYFLISSIFLFISFATLIYGLSTYFTTGIISHGDHAHIRQAYVLSEEDLITLTVGGIFSTFFLISTFIFALLFFDRELVFINKFKNTKFGSKIFRISQISKNSLVHQNYLKNHNFKIKNTYSKEALVYLEKKKLSFKESLKADFFGTSKFSTKSETYKIALSAILLAMTVALSFIEVPGIVLPWGSALKFRFFETITLFFALRMVGVVYTLMIALIAPWLHFAAHAIHLPLDVAFYMINNVLVTFAFYLIYYKFFKAEPIFALENANSSNLVIVNTKKIMARKIMALSLIAIVGALLESLGVFGTYFLIVGDISSLQHKLYYDSLNNRDLVNSYNAFLFIVTSFAIFAFKYITEVVFFSFVEKQILFINKQFGI